MRRTVAPGLLCFVALSGLLAGCSASSPASSTATTSSGTKAGAKVNACTLLKDDEVKAVIGSNNGGGPGAGVGESICEWDNEDTYYSITVSIGNKDTARDGLPADVIADGEKGADGIVYDKDDTANFENQGRACYIQVSTLHSAQDRATAARLIKLVKSRTAGKL